MFLYGVASFCPIPGWVIRTQLPSGHPNGNLEPQVNPQQSRIVSSLGCLIINPRFPSGKLHIAIENGPFIDNLPHGFLVFRSYVKLQKANSHQIFPLNPIRFHEIPWNPMVFFGWKSIPNGPTPTQRTAQLFGRVRLFEPSSIFSTCRTSFPQGHRATPVAKGYHIFFGQDRIDG